MTRYDFCIAWNWEPDADFVKLLNATCQARELSLLQITPDNLTDMLDALVNNRLTFQVFFDRASDEDVRFIPLDQWAHDHAIYRINPRERAVRAWNKAAMHLDLVKAGLHTPHTIVIPSYEEEPDLQPINLSSLGDSFVIKPAHGGSGEGVVTRASSLSHVLVTRQEYPADKYLLQAHITPTQIGPRPAWFRVIYCAEKVFACWWDPHTHIYLPVTMAEEDHYDLTSLRHMSVTIAQVCGLGLFSTEISLAQEGLWIVVDYVNDQIDLRLQSKTPDGVPDDIVRAIAERLVGLAVAQGASE
ncbi:MAG: hypothetical protein AMJ92_02145 [candidate division Zixibacteria bacterium SM23_81]|nr:MAG: hypothetical protein AMJ92_02145 [candidate division Zixibacteria bacterium SM23_81]